MNAFTNYNFNCISSGPLESSALEMTSMDPLMMTWPPYLLTVRFGMCMPWTSQLSLVAKNNKLVSLYAFLFKNKNKILY